MGRPQPSIRNKQLSLLFANAVTVPSSRTTPCLDTVGRTDEHSLFDVFSRVCPSATKDQHQRGDGISLIKFNKLLEADGFQRIRFRAKARKIVVRDSNDFNSYRFGGRRWRDPDNADDMAAIVAFWHCFSKMIACTLQEMADILREALAAEIMLKVKRRPPGTAHPHDHAHASSGFHHPSPSVSLLQSSRSTWGWTCIERASVSPSSSSSSRSSFDEAEGRRSVTDDDEELQAKLAKEQYSTEGLPALYISSALSCESVVAEDWNPARNIKLEPGV